MTTGIVGTTGGRAIDFMVRTTLKTPAHPYYGVGKLEHMNASNVV